MKYIESIVYHFAKKANKFYRCFKQKMAFAFTDSSRQNVTAEPPCATVSFCTQLGMGCGHRTVGQRAKRGEVLKPQQMDVCISSEKNPYVFFTWIEIK